MISEEQYMRRAVDLARAGVGLVSPNPAVGAIVVDASRGEAGSGTHTYDAVRHAEVLALEQAATRARGGTLYVNLEPCSHQGRTPPCVDAVIAAGIQRVVCSMEDPNPKVAGEGFARLRAAGIEVEIGLLAAEAGKLNESFAKFIRRGKPLVTLKSAMTLDGRIAPPYGQRRKRITGETARAHVQQLRHAHDAIMVGVGTVIADDPLLTDRSDLARRRKLLRVILDSHLRIPATSRLLQSAQDDVVIAYSFADDQARQALEVRGARLEQIQASPNGRPDIPALLRRLGEMQITSLLVEGGSQVNAALLRSGEVDKLFLYYAPSVFGPQAVPFVADDGSPCIPQDMTLRDIELHRFGNDFAIEGYVTDPHKL